MLLKRFSKFILVVALVQGCGGSTPPPPSVPSTHDYDPAASGRPAMNPGKGSTKAPDKSPGKAK